jgi:hypothetical protein
MFPDASTQLTTGVPLAPTAIVASVVVVSVLPCGDDAAVAVVQLLEV